MAELIGGQVAGWKVGATVRAVQVFEGHDGPLPGRIFADRLFDSPARILREPVQGREGRVRVRVPPDARSAERYRAGEPRRYCRAADLSSGIRVGCQPLCAGHRQPRRHHIRRHRRQRLRRRRRARRRGRELADARLRHDGDRCPHRRQPADPDLHRRLPARSRRDHRRDLLRPARARRRPAGRHVRADWLALAADAGAQRADGDGEVRRAAGTDFTMV